MSRLIQHRRGTEADSPTLADGEIGVTTDSKKLFYGMDGDNIEVAKKNDLGLNFFVEDFGAKGDGTTDDTYSIQATVNEADAVKGTVIFREGSSYLLTEPIYSKTGRINFNNSKIIFHPNKELNNPYRTIGAFTIAGETTGEVLSVTSFDLTTDSPYFELDSQSFSLGDYALLRIKQGYYDNSKLKPETEKLVKIVNIDGTKYYIDYKEPWSYTQDDITEKQVQKVNPVDGACIKDFDFYDDFSITSDKNTDENYPNNTKLFVSGIVFQFVTNSRISNVRGKNTKFPLVLWQYCSNVQLDTGYLDKPAIVGPGEGYLIQVIDSHHYKCNNLYGDGIRHVLDTTGSSFGDISNSWGSNCYSVDFQCHGKYDHDISYHKCNGKFRQNQGDSYGHAVYNFSFDNCSGTIAPDAYHQNCVISNCKVAIEDIINDLTVINQDIKWELWKYWDADIRSGYSDNHLNFISSKVGIYTPSSNQAISIRNFNSVKFTNCSLYNANEADEILNIDIQDTYNFQIDSCSRIEKMTFRIVGGSTGESLIHCIITKNKINLQSTTNYFITHGYTSDKTIKYNITDNEFIGDNEQNKCLCLWLPSSDSSNDQLVTLAVIKGNHFKNTSSRYDTINTKDQLISQDNIYETSTVTKTSTIPNLLENNINL